MVRLRAGTLRSSAKRRLLVLVASGALVATVGCETLLGLDADGGRAVDVRADAGGCEQDATLDEDARRDGVGAPEDSTLADGPSLDADGPDVGASADAGLDAPDGDAIAVDAAVVINGDAGLPVPIAYWPLDRTDFSAPHRIAARLGPDALVAKDQGQIGVAGQVGTGYQLQQQPVTILREALVVPSQVDDPLELTTAGTISVWAYFQFFPADFGLEYMDLVSKGGFGTDLAIEAAGGTIGTPMQIGFVVGSSSAAGPVTTAASTVTLARGTWYHVVGTFNAPGNVCIYINGSVQSPCANDTAPRAADVQPLKFGDGAYFTGRTFVGTLDEIAIWNVALSASQVAALYALGAAGVPLVGN
jgi:hypothetical protein